jgi:hypothetical protein
MSTEFPISKAGFIKWLASAPRIKIGNNPLSDAIKELNPEVDAFLGDTDWCFVSDLAYQGTQDRQYPKWAMKVVNTGNALGLYARRGELLKELQK